VAPLDGVVRLEARYQAFGRPAAMVFYFRAYDLHPPTFEDCLDLAQQYGLWENSGAGFGYALLRSADSYFTKADVRSIDPRSNAVFSDTVFLRSGQNPDIGSQMIATSCAPLLKWVVAGRGGFHGRTYAVGVAQSTTFLGGDLQTVTPVVADDLITEFRRLIPPPFPASTYGMVSLSVARSIAYPLPVVALPILDVGMPSHLMGTQRRRSYARKRGNPV